MQFNSTKSLCLVCCIDSIRQILTLLESVRQECAVLITDPRGLCALPNGDVLAIDISSCKLYRISRLQVVEIIKTTTVSLPSPFSLYSDL
jgi:hypothetical protein